MLLKTQILTLGAGNYPNHRLYGPNDQIENSKTKKMEPIYYNRRQRRRASNVRLRKDVITQIIPCFKQAKEDVDKGMSVLNSVGKLKSKYLRVIYHVNDETRKKK